MFLVATAGEHRIEVNRLVAMARDFYTVEVRIKSVPMEKIEFCTWSDASWANAERKKSQGGCITAAVTAEMREGKWSVISPRRWRSFKQERHVASTLGAELLSLSKALAETKWMRSMWAEATTSMAKL